MFYSLMLCVDLLSTTMFQKKKVKCIKIDGKTPLTTRQTLVTDFQNNDDVKAAVVCFYLFILCFVTPTPSQIQLKATKIYAYIGKPKCSLKA
ncbi:chromatin remodeling factor18 [Zea mays]|jgi:hypothetical protein|uniref:Chromatin remodeling factor18 n=1 Tax=Zea mays TaxID=4577 RepID=A0A1D6IKR0_MAIZE|nr:chromatin remodeling factor18 [Zea mays]